MKLRVLFICLSLVASASATDLDSAYKTSKAEKSLLTDILLMDDGKLVVVGERGHVLKSSDGEGWIQSDVPLNVNLNAVTNIGNRLLWAVGHDATILHSKDGGDSWVVQQHLPKIDKPLMDVHFFDDHHGFAVGAYGLFFETKNGGELWQQVFPESLLYPEDKSYLDEIKAEGKQAYFDERSTILPHLNKVSLVEGDEFIVAGEGGLIATWAGEQWQRLDEIYTGSFFDIKVLDNGHILLAGLRGNLFSSQDHGESWERVRTGTKASLNAIHVAADNHIYVFGNSGVYLKSTDMGKTFSKFETKEGKAILDGMTYNGHLLLLTEVGVKKVEQ